MAKQNAGDSTPKSGGGSSREERLSQSPLAIRRDLADPTDVDPSPVTSETGDLGYDKNTLKPSGTDPWAPSH